VLAFASCGSTNKVATTAATSSSGRPAPAVKSVIYRVNLRSTEAPRGAPKGSARAVISIDAATHEVCWTFSQLKNVPSATEAEITGHPTIGFTRTLLAQPFAGSGCTHEPALLLHIFEREPQRFEVGIQNRDHPLRSVRGPL
jgi:hypothetical protein